MADFDIKLEGIDHIESSLRELGLNITKKILRGAMKKAAGPVIEEVKRGAIRAAGGPTYKELGHFADHIVAITRVTLKKGVIIRIGPDKDHWWWTFTEYGTPHVPARPFMRPALDSKAQQAIQIVGRELMQGVEREAARLAAKQRKPQ